MARTSDDRTNTLVPDRPDLNVSSTMNVEVNSPPLEGEEEEEPTFVNEDLAEPTYDHPIGPEENPFPTPIHRRTSAKAPNPEKVKTVKSHWGIRHGRPG